jgi:muramoyltetrapeptide carboxypeptidase LdcA involved in peptidoglycan recycling
MSTSARTFIHPNALRPGDKIAALSPSLGLPERFPEVYELGLQRLREVFQLEPVEYPTTRKLNSSSEEKARDFHAAIADPEIQGILCSIGGEGQIKLLKYLDPELIKAHPKPFFGYSDNTNLHLFLLDFGHTDPQVIFPNGSSVTIDGFQKRIFVTY